MNITYQDSNDPCVAEYCSLCTYSLKSDRLVLTRRGGRVETFESAYVCDKNCEHEWGLISACHLDCGNPPSDAVCAVTRYDFDPSPSDSLVHGPNLMRQLSQDVFWQYPQLPLDVCWEISEYLMDTYIAARSAAVQPSEPNKTTLKIAASPVWATFTKLHGQVYVAGLSHEASSSGFSVCLSQTSQDADVLYIGYDAWGVRKVILTTKENTLDIEKQTDVWWDRQEITSQDGELVLEDDGFKLRSVNYYDKTSATSGAGSIPEESDNKLWSVPRQAPVPTTFWKFKTLPEPARLDYITLNDVGAAGYSVCTVSWALSQIVAHYQDQQPRYTHQQNAAMAKWTYMPLQRGEWIEQVWLRRLRFRTTFMAPTLVLVTNTGRVQVMSVQPSKDFEQRFEYQLLAVLPQTPTKMWFDLSGGLRDIAFESTLPLDRKREELMLSLPRPISQYPSPLYRDEFCYTQADLGQVDSMQICRHDKTVLGLLLKNVDGTSSVLGQVRLDCLEKPVEIDRSRCGSGLWLRMEGLGEKPSRSPNLRVLDVEMSRPDDMDGYFELHWNGMFEWWFSSRSSELYYDGVSTTRPPKAVA